MIVVGKLDILDLDFLNWRETRSILLGLLPLETFLIFFLSLLTIEI
jgi:hypothetical protein